MLPSHAALPRFVLAHSSAMPTSSAASPSGRTSLDVAPNGGRKHLGGAAAISLPVVGNAVPLYSSATPLSAATSRVRPFAGGVSLLCVGGGGLALPLRQRDEQTRA